jgi:hypothetical protein
VNTTEKDFKVFQAEFLRQVELFGLGDWDLEFEWKDVEDTEASVEAVMQQRCATVTLAKTIGEGREIEQLARHEALELLLIPLRTIAVERFVTYVQVDEACHAVIQRLIRALGQGEKRCKGKAGFRSS